MGADEALHVAIASPEGRREMLAEMESCPCCQHWLGHNRPPGDAPQASFDFEQ
jgi:hypothetical protein